MSLIRCEHHGRPKGRKQNYVMGVKAVGYPETAAICGRTRCKNPRLLWLTAAEQAAHQKGQSVFAVSNAAVKIKVV